MLDFTLDQEQDMLERTIRRFAEERMRKVFRDAEEDGALPRQVVQAGWEIGLLPTGLPEAYGGFGEYSAVTNVIGVEALAWGDLALTLAILAPNLVAIPLMVAGTPEQQAEYLPQFAGEEPPAVTAALVEPRLRWNPRKLETTAVAGDGGYVLNGVKRLVPLADSAELFLIYAAEEGRVQAFLVPAGTEGLTVGEREMVMGIHALPLFQLSLDNVRVPAENRLGGEAGIDFGLLLNHSRLALGAAAVAGPRRLRIRPRIRQTARPVWRAYRPSPVHRLHARRHGYRRGVGAAARLGSRLEARPGLDITREATVMKQFVDRCSTPPTALCRFSAATATSANTRSSSGCATPAASPTSTE